jgi:hypothetical protein
MMRIISTKHRKSRYDPVYGLCRTHSYPVGTTEIDTGLAFPVRSGVISVRCEVKITSAAPVGIVFELGSATTGLAIWIASADRKLMAAVGDAVADDGVTLTGPVCQGGQKLRIVLAVIPSNGKARLWVNGKLVASGEAVSGTLPNGWSDTGVGMVGDVKTSVTTRVALADRIALSGADISAPVDLFVNQRPLQFFEVA